MSKSLVLTMTPQLGLTSQNPSAYYWRPKILLLSCSVVLFPIAASMYVCIL